MGFVADRYEPQKTRRYLKDLPIPVLTIEFTLKYASCPELDIWLETHRQDMETAVLNDHCFYRTRLPDKEAVFRWLVQHLRVDRNCRASAWKRNCTGMTA